MYVCPCERIQGFDLIIHYTQITLTTSNLSSTKYRIEMSTLAICRVCLACNTKMHHIANTPYQEILDKLAMELYTADGGPEMVCWVCLSALRRGRRLADTARAAHEILTQLSISGIQLSEDTLSMLDRKFLCKLTWTPIQTLSISKEFIHSPIKVEIKEDPSENEEIAGFISKDEEINCNLSEDDSFTVKHKEIFCDNITISENHDDKDEQFNSASSEDDSFTVKNEEIFCDNITISENHVDKDEQFNSASSEDDSFTVKNEEIFCDNVTISENEQSTTDIRNHQFTENLSVNDSKNKVSKTHAENRSKSKRSSEVIVKDQKGQDCVRHICTTCDKTYKQRCHLLRHLKTHSETASLPSGQPPKDMICESCGKGFANNYTLKKHLLAHQGARNFACAHCPIKLVQKSDLVRHMRTHTGQKPYKCDICDKQYSQKAMLVRHMRIHTGETPYSCDTCSLKFNRHSSMVRHVRRRHFSSDKRRYKGQRRPQL